MDASEPDTPFAAVTAQTTRYGRVCQRYLIFRSRFPFAPAMLDGKLGALRVGLELLARLQALGMFLG